MKKAASKNVFVIIPLLENLGARQYGGDTDIKVAGRLLHISTGYEYVPIKHTSTNTRIVCTCTHTLPCPLIPWCVCLGSIAPLGGALKPGEGLADDGDCLGGGVTSGGLFGRDCMAESLLNKGRGCYYV